MSQDLLKSHEAAALLRVHVATIRRAVREGRLAARRVGPRRLIRIEPEALERFATEELRIE